MEDHCSALLAALRKGVPGEAYNIGGRSECRNVDIVHTICAVLDEYCPSSEFVPHERLISFVKDRPRHDHRYAIDPSKVERELRCRPIETFESGIRKTVAWYLQNNSWVEQVTSGSYRDWICEQYGPYGDVLVRGEKA